MEDFYKSPSFILIGGQIVKSILEDDTAILKNKDTYRKISYFFAEKSAASIP